MFFRQTKHMVTDEPHGRSNIHRRAKRMINIFKSFIKQEYKIQSSDTRLVTWYPLYYKAKYQKVSSFAFFV